MQGARAHARAVSFTLDFRCIVLLSLSRAWLSTQSHRTASKCICSHTELLQSTLAPSQNCLQVHLLIHRTASEYTCTFTQLPPSTFAHTLPRNLLCEGTLKPNLQRRRVPYISAGILLLTTRVPYRLRHVFSYLKAMYTPPRVHKTSDVHVLRRPTWRRSGGWPTRRTSPPRTTSRHMGTRRRWRPSPTRSAPSILSCGAGHPPAFTASPPRRGHWTSGF